MTEIEKMFENTGIKKAPDINNCYPEMMKCYHCEHYKVINEYTGRCLNEVYPDFTEEKQLRLLKKINKKWIIEISYSIDAYHITAHSNNGEKEYFQVNNYFDEGLANIINDLWQDLTDQEKEEIRGILNE